MQSNLSFFPGGARLMKRAAIGANGDRTAAARRARSPHTIDNTYKENHMKSKKQPVVRKPAKKIADARRIRFGTGCAPAKLARSADATTADSGAIRFGTGCAPACLRK
jgi:hypothetical protein